MLTQKRVWLLGLYHELIWANQLKEKHVNLMSISICDLQLTVDARRLVQYIPLKNISRR